MGRWSGENDHAKDKKKREPQRVSELLGAFLEKKGLRESVLRVGSRGGVGELVGEAIARVTRAQGVRQATLIVEVRSSSWLMELNLMKEEILSRVNEGRYGSSNRENRVRVCRGSNSMTAKKQDNKGVDGGSSYTASRSRF